MCEHVAVHIHLQANCTCKIHIHAVPKQQRAGEIQFYVDKCELEYLVLIKV